MKYELYKYLNHGGVDNEISDIPMNATVTRLETGINSKAKEMCH